MSERTEPTNGKPAKAVVVRKKHEVAAPTPIVVSDTRSMVAALINIIADAARDPTCDASKMAQLVALQQNVLAWEAERIYDEAYAEMWPKLKQVERLGDVDTGKGKYKFAQMEDIDAMIRPILGEHGFSLQFIVVEETDDMVHIVGYLRHRGGHKVASSMRAAPDAGPGRNRAQAIGSIKTYLERYIAEGLLNLVRKGGDDDGRGGGYTPHDRPTGSITRMVDNKPKQDEPNDKAPERVRPRFATDEKSWLGKAERKLWEVEPSGRAWLKVLNYATKTAPDPDSLTALEGMTKSYLDNAPPDARTEASAAFLKARLRLSLERQDADNQRKTSAQPNPNTKTERQPDEPFLIVDPFGEIIASHTDPVIFAREFADEWGHPKYTDEQRTEMLVHNEDTIDRAKADRSAAEILRTIEEDPLPPDVDAVWSAEAIEKFEACQTRAGFKATFEWAKPTMLRLKKNKPHLFDQVDAVVAKQHKALPNE